ncbi:hypothetical protein [Providencia rettgeri]|uniref:phage tail tube protein n=1 Tax=Providencia rettgeri TaxID=587 RepID=UPI001B37ADC4|nr:hypothetical protein [Providencia rettgeri]ELY3855406.1 hypothetical protein [Providencia rettgeri]MBQ0366023.1 hypothetical protein [Providencia rettgeri]
MSDYFYGQGKVSLAVRQPGKPLNLRWVGDVDQLTVSFATRSQMKQHAQKGIVHNTQKHITHQSCQVSANFFTFSPENIALAVFGQSLATKARAAKETLPMGLVSGGRYALQQVNLWDVVMPGLVDGIDYRIDVNFGTLEILKTPLVQPITVHYKYAGGDTIPFLTNKPLELMLRYEAINLAEEMSPVLVELYRLQFDVTDALELINNATTLSSFELNADVLLDATRPANDLFGQYGRYVISRPITHASQGTLTPVITTGAVGGTITTVYPRGAS